MLFRPELLYYVFVILSAQKVPGHNKAITVETSRNLWKSPSCFDKAQIGLYPETDDKQSSRWTIRSLSLRLCFYMSHSSKQGADTVESWKKGRAAANSF